VPGVSLRGWGLGAKITTPEWLAGIPEEQHQRACFSRNGPVRFSAKFVATAPTPLHARVTVTPSVDGSTSVLGPVTVDLVYPAGAAEAWIDVTLGGTLPDEVGRYALFLRWGLAGTDCRFAGPLTTRHRIYAAYGQPLEAGFDDANPATPGRNTTQDAGTGTGTRKRLDLLTALIGGEGRRHPARTQADLESLVWQLHCGINDTPGRPPYFNASHDAHLTDPSGLELPLEDQWLAWLQTPAPHWNDASCIGHVQVAKTMLASVGLFARRSWVFPTTSRLPDGTVLRLSDQDCYCLGHHNLSKHEAARQKQTLRDPAGNIYQARPKLLEPGDSWENFEACMLSPTGRFLPGGYNTSQLPSAVRTARGFGSAAELIRWWSNTTRPVFGKRFMAWAAQDSLRRTHYWDVDGKHYDAAHVLQIRSRGKELPPP